MISLFPLSALARKATGSVLATSAFASYPSLSLSPVLLRQALSSSSSSSSLLRLLPHSVPRRLLAPSASKSDFVRRSRAMQHHSQTRSTSPPPLKRARRTNSPGPNRPSSSGSAISAMDNANGHAYPQASGSSSDPYNSPNLSQSQNTPNLSLSQNHPQNPLALQPLSLSILGVEPLDEFIREIADFVHHMILTRPEQHLANAKVEVEAKIGVLREGRGGQGAGQRMGLPVLVETILAPGFPDIRFESNMSVHQHKHFNTLLNGLKTKSTSSSHPSSPISYEHLYLTDSFYPAPEGGGGGGGPGGGGRGEKIRVTRDTNTGQLVECVRKVRLGDLNVYCPKREADWRVSVNLEIPMPHPVGSASHKRVKDRLSYSHEEFKIDLTQVTATNSPNAPPQILHELELEIARPEFLLATALKRNDASAPEHERAAFDELIRAFVNNARILVRNAVEGW